MHAEPPLARLDVLVSCLSSSSHKSRPLCALALLRHHCSSVFGLALRSTGSLRKAVEISRYDFVGTPRQHTKWPRAYATNYRNRTLVRPKGWAVTVFID